MAKITIPTLSSDLIKMLDKRFPDIYDVDNKEPFERGKYAGIIELLRELKQGLKEM